MPETTMETMREMTLKEYLSKNLPPNHRARICFDDLEFFCKSIIEGLGDKYFVDTGLHEELENVLRRGRRALEGLKP